MDITITIIIGYLFGSIPNAYLVARSFGVRDLRTEGSGNIGARNAYEVTTNKAIGIAVLMLDIFKGLIPIIFLVIQKRIDLIPFAVASIVLGHCYSIWIRFHGGRGLATAAAITAVCTPVLLPAWVLFYFLCSIIRKNVHFQAMIATFSVLILELVLYEDTMTGIYSILHWNIDELQILHYAIILILGIIVSRHLQPVSEYLSKSPL